MPVEFKLPDLGEGIHEAEIIEVLVRVGDRVEDGHPVLVVETDKATTEVPAPVTGTVTEIRVKPGDTVRVGEVMMVFRKEEESEIAEEKVPPGEEARAKLREPSPAEEEKEAPSEVQAEAAPEKVFPAGEGPVPAAPSTRRLARELGVNLRDVAASGPGGRVTPDDVRAFAERAKQAEPRQEPAPGEEAREPLPAEAPPLPEFDKLGPIERVALRSVRRATARHMALSWSQIPHVSHADVADITELEEFRKKHSRQVREMGGALSLLVFVMKTAAAALRKFPRFNSSLDTEAGEIVLKHYYNIGIAVDTDRGLIVPVIRDVERKSVFDLAIELRQIAEKTREGKAGTEDMAGGTFTITNIGALGGTGFSPIINYPQTAILGMAQARLQPVVTGDEHGHKIVPRLMLPLILAIDHRVLDGADAARFLNTIIEALENPENLLMMI